MDIINKLIGYISADIAIQTGLSIVIITFVAVITLLFIVPKIYPTFNHATPLANTLTESLPVLGLMGTFAAAFVAFPGRGIDEIKGILFAFIISFTAWAFYIITSILVAWQSKTPEEVIRDAKDQGTNLSNKTTEIGNNLDKIYNELERIVNVMERMNRIVSIKTINGINNPLNVTVNTIDKIASLLNSISNNIMQIKEQTNREWKLNINSENDLNKLNDELNNITKTLDLFDKIEMKHDINVAINDDLQNKTNNINELTRALKNMEAGNNKYIINIEVSDDISKIADNINKLNNHLNTMSKINPEKRITITTDYDLNKILNESNLMNNMFEKMNNSLKGVKNEAEKISIDIELPMYEEIEKTSESINKMTKTMKLLDNIPDNIISNKINIENINETADKIDKLYTKIFSFNSIVNELKNIENRYDIEIKLPSDMEQIIDKITKFKNIALELPDNKNIYNYEMNINGNISETVNKIEKAKAIIEELNEYEIIDKIGELDKFLEIAKNSLKNINSIPENLEKLKSMIDIIGEKTTLDSSTKKLLDKIIETLEFIKNSKPKENVKLNKIIFNVVNKIINKKDIKK